MEWVKCMYQNNLYLKYCAAIYIDFYYIFIKEKYECKLKMQYKQDINH